MFRNLPKIVASSEHWHSRSYFSSEAPRGAIQNPTLKEQPDLGVRVDMLAPFRNWSGKNDPHSLLNNATGAGKIQKQQELLPHFPARCHGVSQGRVPNR